MQIMNKKSLHWIILTISLIFMMNCTNTVAPETHGPVPSENQMRWHEMEYYAFIHFSLNTYTDQAWGFGNEDLNLFNPEDLDTRQWARICKEAGMKGIIITAKHHCGFCLWPTETTEYSVENTPWKDGEGDVLRELADACKEYGLKFGIYVSPWDRNHPDYGKPEYITVFRNQIKEVLTNYGEVFEIWFDGANGGDGYYGGANETRKIDRTNYYDWQPTYKMIRELQPDIVIWNDGGDRADLRWVGTEEGYVGETNWSLLNDTGEVDWGMLHFGLETGNAWVPAEVNTSIRPEWFYHPAEDDQVKTVPQLMDTYYKSIGRNGTLLLNFPIMPNGLIHPTDEKRALEFAKAVQESFEVNLAKNAKAKASNVRGNSSKFDEAKAVDGKDKTYWATDDGITNASIIIDLGKQTLFNRFMAQEYIRLGQRVEKFTVEALVDGEWKEVTNGTTIGYKRIIRFPSVSASKVRFTITASKSSPLISNIGIYNAPVFLNAPSISRNQKGEVALKTNDIGPIFYYTLNGSEPTPESNLYTGPFLADGKIEVKAIAYDPASGKSSPVAAEKFDISKKDWRNIDANDENMGNMFDGDPSTTWHKRGDKIMPFDLKIDLGKSYNIRGFKYLPDQNKWSSGIISNYQFFVSIDSKNWKLVSEGEFSNIKNNPVWQIKNFTRVNARYIKLRALKNTWGDQVAGFAEMDVITE
jgi:alpha-L-fucosidase